MSAPETNSDGELWIGLAEVNQMSNPGILGSSEGAFTNAIAHAVSRSSFRFKVKDALGELGLDLKRLENAETLDARLAKHSVDPELTKVAEEVRTSGRAGFGTFHTFGGNDPVETPVSRNSLLKSN
jgi:hypothetical protein